MEISGHKGITGVALIELSGSHDEVIYSQVEFLRFLGIPFRLVCTPKLADRLRQLGINEGVIWFDEEASLLTFFRQCRQTITKLRADLVSHVVFNTASNTEIRNMLLFGFRSFNCTGILHYGPKLQESFTQKQISFFIKKYLVPARFIVDNMVPFPKNIRVIPFYPTIYPKFNLKVNSISYNDNIRLVVPGQVEQKRRDYEYIIELFKQQLIPDHVSIILAGQAMHRWGCGKDIIAAVPEAIERGQLKLFDQALDWPEFMQLAESADLIWPLAHPGKGSFPQYSKWQISGAYNLAYALGKPLLMHDYFERYDEFKAHSIFYSLENFPQVLAGLLSNDDQISKISNAIKNNLEFSLKHQAERYRDFILS